MLEAWKGHYRFAVVSNFYMPNWPAQLLERFGLLHHFEFVIDSAAEDCRKPESAFYQIALERAKAKPEEVIFIGDDHRNDVLAPRELGMRALHRARYQQRPGIEKSPESDAIVDWDDFRPDRWENPPA